MQKLFYLFVIVPCILIACTKPICDYCPGGNKPPVAIAGRDTTIALPVDSLVLDGSASHDPDGKIKHFFWRNISNLPCSIINHPVAKATVKNLVAGTYKFELQVADDLAFSTYDTVVVTVMYGVATRPPVANAGPDQTITLPTHTATLDGSKSYDSSGAQLNFLWKQISGAQGTISSPTTASTAVSFVSHGVLQFELQVSNSYGRALDTVAVTVSGANKPPIANAGADQTITSPQNWALLDGSLSQDPDGNIVSFDWTKVAGDYLEIYQTPNSSKASAYYFEPGAYQIQLQVMDNNGVTARDTINVTVLPDSLTKDTSVIKRFNKLWWGNTCTISIHNISSAIPAVASMQVFIHRYDVNPWQYTWSDGWVKVDAVKNYSYWYEIHNDVLIIHAPANLLCLEDEFSGYDVLIKWN